MKKIIMLKTDEGVLRGRMRRLLKDKKYDVINILAEILIKKKSAVLVKINKRKRPHKNKAITTYENKEAE